MRKTCAALFASVLTLGAVLSAATPGGASPPPPRARLTLPAPTGPYPVGTVDLHLIDRARPNPWAAAPPYRELMVSVWYPARDVGRYPVAPQMRPGAAAHFGSADGDGMVGASLYGIPPGSVDFAATPTSGHRGAPAAPHRRPFPVVLYSPGAGDPRTWETTAVQDLASRGFVVVTIDHTYDASEVEFPGGRVVASRWPQWFQDAQAGNDFPGLAAKVFDVRIADTGFVLDQLTARNRERRLPAGLGGALDLDDVGMFGVSAGGLIALQTMAGDRRIRAAVDLGGNVESPLIPDTTGLWPVQRTGLNQPFMLVGDASTDHRQTPSWTALWDHSRGWHVDVHLDGANGEDSYKDTVPLMPQIARRLGLPGRFVTDVIGTVDPARAVTAEETLVGAFFDRWLRHGDGRVLDGPSPGLPGVTFVP
jgi:dienelactone hydrolase